MRMFAVCIGGIFDSGIELLRVSRTMCVCVLTAAPVNRRECIVCQNLCESHKKVPLMSMFICMITANRVWSSVHETLGSFEAFAKQNKARCQAMYRTLSRETHDGHSRPKLDQ